MYCNSFGPLEPFSQASLLQQSSNESISENEAPAPFIVIEKSPHSEYYSILQKNNIFDQSLVFLRETDFEKRPLPCLFKEQYLRIQQLLLQPVSISDREGKFCFDLNLAGLLGHLFSKFNFQSIEITGSYVYSILGEEWMNRYLVDLGLAALPPNSVLQDQLKKPMDVDLHLNIPGANEQTLRSISEELLIYFASFLNPQCSLEQRKSSILKSCFSKYGYFNNGVNHGFCFSFGGTAQRQFDLVIKERFHRSYLFDSDGLFLKIESQKFNSLLSGNFQNLMIPVLGKSMDGQKVASEKNITGWKMPALRLAKIINAYHVVSIDLVGRIVVFSKISKGEECASIEFEKALLEQFFRELSQPDRRKDVLQKLLKSFVNHLPGTPSAAAAFCFNILALMHRHAKQQLCEWIELKQLWNARIEENKNCLETILKILNHDKTLFEALSAYLVIYSHFKQILSEGDSPEKSIFLYRQTVNTTGFQLQFALPEGALHLQLSYSLIESLKILHEHAIKERSFLELNELTGYFLTGNERFEILENLSPDDVSDHAEIVSLAFVFLKVSALKRIGFCLLCRCAAAQVTTTYLNVLTQTLMELYEEEVSLSIRKSLVYFYLYAYQKTAGKLSPALPLSALTEISSWLDKKFTNPSEKFSNLCQMFLCIPHEDLVLTLCRTWEERLNEAIESRVDAGLIFLGEKLIGKSLSTRPEWALKAFKMILRTDFFLENRALPVDQLQALVDWVHRFSNQYKCSKMNELSMIYWEELAFYLKSKSYQKTAQFLIEKYKLFQMVEISVQLREMIEDVQCACAGSASALEHDLALELIRLYGGERLSFWELILPRLPVEKMKLAIEALPKFSAPTAPSGICWLSLLRKFGNAKSVLFSELLAHVDTILEASQYQGPQASDSRAEALFHLSMGFMHLLWLPSHRNDYFYSVFNQLHKIETQIYANFTGTQKGLFAFLYVESFLKTTNPAVFRRVIFYLEILQDANSKSERFLKILTEAICQLKALKEDPEYELALKLDEMIAKIEDPLQRISFLSELAEHPLLHMRGHGLIVEILEKCPVTKKSLLFKKYLSVSNSIAKLILGLAKNPSKSYACFKLLSAPAIALLFPGAERVELLKDALLHLSKSALIFKELSQICDALDCYDLAQHAATPMALHHEVIADFSTLILLLYFEHHNPKLYYYYFFKLLNFTFCNEVTALLCKAYDTLTEEELLEYFKLDDVHQFSELVNPAFKGRSLFVFQSRRFGTKNLEEKENVLIKNVGAQRAENFFQSIYSILNQLTQIRSDEFEEQLFILQHFYKYLPILTKSFAHKSSMLHTLLYNYALRYIPSNKEIFELQWEGLKFLYLEVASTCRKRLSSEKVYELILLAEINVCIELPFSDSDQHRCTLKILKGLTKQKSLILTDWALAILKKVQIYLYKEFPKELLISYGVLFSAILEGPFYINDNNTLLELLFNSLCQKELHSAPFVPCFTMAVAHLFLEYFDLVIEISRHHPVPRGYESYCDFLSKNLSQIWKLPSMQEELTVKTELLNKLVDLGIDEVQLDRKVAMLDALPEIARLCNGHPLAEEEVILIANRWIAFLLQR